jgi:microcystin-dependent protein
MVKVMGTMPVSAQALTNIDADLGAQADAPATTDTGTFSLIAFVKRGMQNSTTLLARIPAAIIPGLLPVDTLATPTRMVPHALTAASTSVALATATRRVSVDVSVNAIVRIGAAASVPANGTELLNAIAIPGGSTKDFDVPASTTLHFIRDGSVDGTIRITELV